MMPDNADGWTNVGRVRVQEGNTEGALEVLKKALALKPGLARANFFYARVLKEEGKYDEAARSIAGSVGAIPARIAWCTTNWDACCFCRSAMRMR